MDNKNIVVDPHEEVRKLQDLVRKLELQNQQLRSKQNLVTRQRNAKEANPVSSMSVSDSKVGAEKGCLTNSINCSMEDDDLIDVSLLDLSNEDSWLYESPQMLTPEQKALSPYQWLRLDMEDVQNTDIQTVKRALVRKIEELSRAPNPYVTVQNSTAQRHHLNPDNTVEQRSKCSGGHKYLLSPKEFDSRTFTRSKKRHPFELPVVDGEVSVKDDALHGSCTPPLSDLIDIHTLARLQEESLRQSSPPSTPRRNSAGSTCQKSGMSSINTPLNESDEGETSLGNLTFTISGPNSFLENSPRTLSSRTSSTSASPSASPRGSQYFDDVSSSVIAKGARSRPSRPLNGLVPPGRVMNRGVSPGVVNGMKDSGNMVITDQLQRTQGNTMLQYQERSSRSTSPATKTSGALLHNCTLVMDSVPSRGIHSRIPKPRAKSSIPTYSRNRATVDESWKEGCY